MLTSDLERFQLQFGDALASSAQDGVQVLDAALARALAVHRNTIAKAVQDALAANYPVLRALCGEEAFFAWAADFIGRTPAREARLNAFGAGFEAFLRTYEPARSMPYAADIAAIERLVNESLFAVDAKPLNGAGFVARLQAGRGVALHPATRFATLASPAASIWLAHQDPEPEAFDTLQWSVEEVLVTRPAGHVEVRVAAPGVAAFLNAWVDEGPVAAAWAAKACTDRVPLMAWLIGAGVFA